MSDHTDDHPVDGEGQPDLQPGPQRDQASLPGSGGHPGARKLHSGRKTGTKRGEQHYLPTLFDRLCDDAPSEKSEPPSAYVSSRTQMRAIVQRDLALLLNTTDQSDLIDPIEYPAAADSTINYGVAALAGGYLSEKKWHDLEVVIRRAIRLFEPRLVPDSVVVSPLLKAQASANYNVLTFEISGLVNILPYPMEFVVQSDVDLETNRIVLKNSRS